MALSNLSDWNISPTGSACGAACGAADKSDLPNGQLLK